MKEYKIYCIGDLIEVISQLPKTDVYWYRGFSDINYPLIPSVQRGDYHIDIKTKNIKLERKR